MSLALFYTKFKQIVAALFQTFAANVDAQPSKPPVIYSKASYGIISGSPYTPVRRYMGNTGVIVRDVKDDELFKIYTWFWQSAKAGQGFSLTEIGDFTYFAETLLHNSVAVVFEDAKSGKVVFTVIMRNAGKFRRHNQIVTNTGFVVINPEWKKGLNQHAFLNVMFDTSLAISKQLGFDYIVSSTNIHNHRMLRNLEGQHDRFSILGTIPDAVYMEGRGFTDIVVLTFQEQRHKDGPRGHLNCNM